MTIFEITTNYIYSLAGNNILNALKVGKDEFMKTFFSKHNCRSDNKGNSRVFVIMSAKWTA